MGWNTSRADRLFQSPDAVNDPAGDAPHVARAEQPGDASDGELEPALQQDPHLFVRMGMIEHDGFGFQMDDRQHQVLAGGRADLDTGKDQVPRPRSRRDEVVLDGLQPSVLCPRTRVMVAIIGPVRIASPRIRRCRRETPRG